MTTCKAKVIGSFIPPEGDELIEAMALKEREGRHSIAEAILRLKTETGSHFALDKEVDTGEIPSYAPGKSIRIKCNPSQRDMREEIYWDDINAWLVKHTRVIYRFPSPSAALGGVGAGTSMARIPKQRAQEVRILELLKAQGHDPKSLSNRRPGTPGPKAEIRALALGECELFTTKTFDTAWQRLRDAGNVAGAK